MKKLLLLLPLLVSLAYGQHQNLSKGVALHGYDPVSYLDDKKAVEGDARWSSQHNGATYYFSSQEHQQRFRMSMDKYVPAYGGWCAYAMGATGEKVDVDPETFKIINGRTYLFYNAYFNNTLKSWNKDEANLKAAADRNWQKLTAGK